ncbi:putative N-acetyltransferase YhbS [Fontibacillus solani]|uniref:Putative N-acetyltransferase YhbS n=1 Tax=Fontibacillus solani TaxID=1572857 RepID=A0A7W3SU59_9BACL|nr:GNAT family N-acetyltransferase [Fontibacillus solani]MBA9086203.1 putative N-acetyltransferase YhbS [Fontibacillus solani]
MQYFIRRADTKDIDDLSNLFVDFIGKDSDKDKMEEQLRRINENSNYYVAVAEAGSRVIGTAMGIICYDLVGDSGTFMLVENVVVAPDYQGHGVGKALMNSIERFGLDNQCKYVILVSESKREGSHEFYNAVGYTTDQKGFKKKIQ